MALDRKTYAAGDPARLTVTLTNTGQYPLTGLYAGCDRLGTRFHLLVTEEAWGELAYSGAGADRPTGTDEVLLGRRYRAGGRRPLRCGVRGLRLRRRRGIRRRAANAPRLDRKVRSGKTADTEGVVFHDKDDDHSVHEGEAVANTRVGLRDVTTGRLRAATTDAAGRIDFTGVPAGRYDAQIFGPWEPLHPVIAIAAEP